MYQADIADFFEKCCLANGYIVKASLEQPRAKSLEIPVLSFSFNLTSSGYRCLYSGDMVIKIFGRNQNELYVIEGFFPQDFKANKASGYKSSLLTIEKSNQNIGISRYTIFAEV